MGGTKSSELSLEQPNSVVEGGDNSGVLQGMSSRSTFSRKHSDQLLEQADSSLGVGDFGNSGSSIPVLSNSNTQLLSDGSDLGSKLLELGELSFDQTLSSIELLDSCLDS